VKKSFKKPEIKISSFITENIITASGVDLAGEMQSNGAASSVESVSASKVRSVLGR
jgi:hypothetical protein